MNWLSSKGLQRLVISLHYNMSFIDVVIKSLTAKDNCQVLLLNLWIVFFCRCHGLLEGQLQGHLGMHHIESLILPSGYSIEELGQ